MSEKGGTSELRISAWAIRNPTPVAVLFIALVVAGLFSYFQLPVKNFPNVEFPAVSVTVTRSGAAPAEMETQVARPIENALSGLSNVVTIASSVNQGESTTVIQFELGQDLQKATDDVRSKVDQTRAELPRDVDPPIVQRLEIDDQPIISYAVVAPNMSEQDLSWFIDNTLTRVLQARPGVAQVSRVGGVDREVNVIVDPDRMAALGVTADQINTALNAVSIDAPGGRVSVGDREQTLRVLGGPANAGDIRNLTIPASGGRFVRLSDVADVGDGSSEVRSYALLNGKPVVGFQVSKTKDSSDVAVEDQVDAALHDLQFGTKASFGHKATAPQYPDVHITKILSRVDSTRAGFSATVETLLEGMLLAAGVVFLFLRDWRATAVTAVAMPVSLIPTFAFMHMFGFSLNMVTLLGLTLVIGILVDDAIVEIENIEKRTQLGMRPYQAAIEGADQIGLAVVATTFALAAVFFPVSFMPGIPGQFFREFGLTVSVAVLFSLVVARLLTPLMAAYFLTPKEPHPRKPLPAFYMNTLTWALDHRWVTLGIATLLFFASMALFAPLPKGVQPEGNPNYYTVVVDAPPGSTIADMRQVIDAVDKELAKQPETEAVYSTVGAGGGGGGPGGGFGGGAAGITKGSVTAILKPHRDARVGQIRDRIRPALRQIPDARITFDNSGFGAAGVSIILTSETGEGLESTALELQREMRSIPGVAEPRFTTPPTGPEVVIKPRPDEAARLGVSVNTIASAARVATVGDADSNVPKMNDGERRIPIRVRLPVQDRADLATIKNLRLPTASGGWTTLDTVADVYFEAGAAQISRFDRKRNITTTADLSGGAQLGDVLQKVNRLPILQHLPAGIAPASQGQEQAIGQLFGGFIAAIASAVGLVYAVMVLLFRSFFKPVVILAALPTAIGGAFLALLLWHSMLAIPSLIGFLMLMGLAAKNSILLVEYAIEREREGHSQRDSLIEACRERARPIIMTTLAMASGMLPTALSLGEGSEFRQPMAVAVIGGLITSTALSLVLVPVVYEFVDDVERWLSPRFAKLVTPRDAPLQPAPQDRL
ncbi:efflux RND transporter permease subunit [Caulobacter sp. KR2-114]|uniref:efflux RND transporter permease subunit n=1 Tax=Caulobacter sp. KR2-114 TaxID=3400912 RepID=UPI003C02F4B3